MTLDTASTLNFGWHGTLSAPLNLDLATYLRYFDLPVPGAHLEGLGVMARVVIGTLLNQPTRPWGLVTELAAAFETSRETLYEIAARLRVGVLVRPNGRRPIELKVPEVTTASAYPSVTVTPNRVERTVLTNLLPGGMTLRHQLDSLQTALDTQRSTGWISEFIRDAGQRAGRKLDEISLAPLGAVVTNRDELYFDDKVFLLHVEPRHMVIVRGYAEDGCDAQTWGVALQLDAQTRGLQIIGLAEDGAPMYPASVREAELSLQIQKDVWHIEATARQAVTDLERLALKAMERAERLLRPIEKDAAHLHDARLAEWV